MTTSPITLPSLIQRRGDAELPANGTWTLNRVSFIGASSGHARVQLSVSHGLLKVADDSRPSTLTIIATKADTWLRLDTSSIDILPDRHGMSTWHLTGELENGDGRHPVDVNLTYHGTHRRGDQAWAWFTGRATRAATPPRILRRRGELTVVLDLLFDAPPPSRSRTDNTADEQPVVARAA